MPTPLSPTDYNAVVHSPPDTVNDAHDFLQRVWAERPDVTVAERTVVEMVLSELVTNVIQNNPHRQVFCEVNLTIDPELLVIETVDTGDPVPQLPDVSMPDENAEHGRGLALIELMVDDLRYAREGSRNIWRARKARSA